MSEIKKTLDEYIENDLKNTDLAKMILAKIYNHIEHAEFSGDTILISTDDGKMWLIQGIELKDRIGSKVLGKPNE